MNAIAHVDYPIRMPVEAHKFIRKMRGGAQAHLIEADDGHCYVVKFVNNPQHRRILVNELIASIFLKYLQIAAPAIAIVRLTQEFLTANPQIYFTFGSKRVAVDAGWHFGSRFPGDPDRQMVYDFLPDALLNKIENQSDFLGILAFDKWMGNADSRQSIFFRARLKEYLPSVAQPLRVGLVASMMDHGFVFNGPHWDFVDSPLQGLYFRQTVYAPVRSIADFEPWIERIRHFPEEVLDDAIKQIPASWLDPKMDDIEKLLAQLLRRRNRVADLIDDCRRGRINPFPNWR